MVRNIIRIDFFLNKCLERMLNIKLTELFDGFRARPNTLTFRQSNDKAADMFVLLSNIKLNQWKYGKHIFVCFSASIVIIYHTSSPVKLLQLYG